MYTDGSSQLAIGTKDQYSTACAVVSGYMEGNKFYPQHTFTQTLGDHTAQLEEVKALVMVLEHTVTAQLTVTVCDSYYCVQSFNEYLNYWRQNGLGDSRGKTIKHRLLWGKVEDLKEPLPNVHVVHTLGHQRIGIHVGGNTLVDEAAKSAVAMASVAAVTHSITKPDNDIWAAVKATAEGTPFPKACPAKYSYQMGDFLNAEVKIPGVGVPVIPNKDLRPELIKAAHEGVASTHAGVAATISLLQSRYWWPNRPSNLDGPGVEVAETPFDINECVSVLQELQQFRDHNASTTAASVGIKDAPIKPTGWIAKVGNLVCEKVAVKNEFGPSYRAPVPVFGIHGTRTVISPPLPGPKENRFVSIDNVKLHHVADPAQQTKRRTSSTRIPLTTGHNVPLQVLNRNVDTSLSLARVENDLALVPLTSIITSNTEIAD
ncbi:hypothetical protein NDU88_010946 [Pleurodeles waltl]|uniref:RNase H type-1 domain-containing protein n=1 Tax=Pleurodeles waltl TaxID=8319 RepID=A0AAV7R076_PLEWA|nr:hypothetical protein NDU88_010946 [Pleurodeles waltl]